MAWPLETGERSIELYRLLAHPISDYYDIDWKTGKTIEYDLSKKIDDRA